MGRPRWAVIVSLSLPDELVRQLDQVITERGYKGRSEIVRAALRDFVKLHKKEGELKGHVGAVVVLQYPESTERDLSAIRHAHNDLVKSMLHAHTSDDQCTTILHCEGGDQKIRRFLAELRGLRGVKSVDVNLT